VPAGIHHEVCGDGPPLLLLPGLTEDVTLWGGCIAVLAGHFRVIALDPRGSGRSTAPLEGLDTTVMAGDALALLDELGVTRAHVLGFSLGGMAAQVLAARSPTRVDRLVLASTGLRIGGVGMAAIRATRDLFASRGCQAFAAEAMLPWLLGEKALLDGRIAEDLARRRFLPSLEGFSAQCLALEAHDGRALAPRITAPTLCVAGAEDVLIPPAQARDIVRSIPQAQAVEVAGCGHMCSLEAPEAFQRAVLDFLAG